MADSGASVDDLVDLIDEWEKRTGFTFGETWRLELLQAVERVVAAREMHLDALLRAERARAAATEDFLKRREASANARMSGLARRLKKAEERLVRLEQENIKLVQQFPEAR